MQLYELTTKVSDVWTEFTHYLRRDGVTGETYRMRRNLIQF